MKKPSNGYRHSVDQSITTASRGFLFGEMEFADTTGSKL